MKSYASQHTTFSHQSSPWLCCSIYTGGKTNFSAHNIHTMTIVLR